VCRCGQQTTRLTVETKPSQEPLFEVSIARVQFVGPCHSDSDVRGEGVASPRFVPYQWPWSLLDRSPAAVALDQLLGNDPADQ
jgi:hypothetical protein